MKEINIYEIIKKHSNICFDDYDGVEEAIKDACQQVLELAAENVKIDILKFPLDTEHAQGCIEVIEDGYNEREYHIHLDKQSILDVINKLK